MSIIINGTTGISGVDGTAGSPALQGNDTNTGVVFGTDTVGVVTGGVQRTTVDSSGRLLVGTSTSRGNNFNASSGTDLRFQVEGTDYLSSGASFTCNGTGSPGDSTHIVFSRTRGSSLGSNTIVSNGDRLAGFFFQGADGSELVQAATIEAFVDGTPGANDMPGRLVFSTTADGASSPTERMRISASGAVFLNGGVLNALPFGVSSATAGTTGGNFPIVAFESTGTGDVGAAVLHLVKKDNSTATSNPFQRFYINSNTGSGMITANGASAAAFGTFSDIRLKENVTNLLSQWDSIKSLRPVEFDYVKSFGGGHQIGFIAQEMQAVYSDAVGEGENKMLTITAWSKTEARLVKALQEAMERIEQLETRISNLEVTP